MLGEYFSAQVTGCQYGTWWYVISNKGTEVSTDKGHTWTKLDMGWSLPTNWYGAQASQARCAGSSPLNWMSSQSVDWWKLPVAIPNSSAAAATWMWFDSSTQAPVRMMFGYGPPKPTMGDPKQLAFFQMWSFSYVPEFKVSSSQHEVPAKPKTFEEASISGFQVGNPDNFQNFVWNSNFGMTAFMTPVNEQYNPLPTRVLYVWKDDKNYSTYRDRAQNTLMQFNYNAGTMAAQEALLTGPAPSGTTPPPSLPNYPEATYLWTWYAPQNATGTASRPVTFMQSQSGVNQGTSLALADYFYCENFQQPIDPANFDIPESCSLQTRSHGLRRRLP